MVDDFEFMDRSTLKKEVFRLREELETNVFLWEILVPTIKRKNGRPIRTRYHRVWDSKVREITKGLTILLPSKGQWVSPSGELFVERMIPVRIACTRSEMDKIADMTAEYYDQLAIFYYKVSDEVIIKNYDK